jgi:RNA polymerase sigma-70 factor (ECF subfamily)
MFVTIFAALRRRPRSSRPRRFPSFSLARESVSAHFRDVKGKKPSLSAAAPGTAARFEPTQWTVVRDAANRGAAGAAEALEQLCVTYWYPLYAFLRRSGRSPHDAQDLVQGFFIHLLAKESRLQAAHPAKGQFRSFLLACLKHYVANRDDWERVRSPRQPMLSIDENQAEERYQREPADITDPARIYERRWAITALEQAMERLRQDQAKAGKSALFKALTPHLIGDGRHGDLRSIAATLGMKEGAVRTALSRLRESFQNSLKKEVAQTVSDPAEVKAEINRLFALFAR